MRVVVLVKYVPEPTATWKFSPDLTLDRKAVPGRLSELDEYAAEQAVRLAEAGTASEVTYLTVGPADAKNGLQKALAIGGDKAVHVTDDAIRGSDALATSLVLAEALKKIGFDLVLAGLGSTDAEMSVIPSMLAERLGINQIAFANSLTVSADSVTAKRETDVATEELTTALPAIVSVTDQTDEARYPAFKAIMMAKKKPIETLSLSDLGITPDQVGLVAAATTTSEISPAPTRQAGTVIDDDGTAAAQVVEYLVARGAL